VRRLWTALVLLLAAQAALSAAAALAEVLHLCTSCGSGRFVLGLAGFVYYSALFGSALLRGPSRLLFAGILFAFGVHASLVGQMILIGLHCGLCIAAAAGSLFLVGLSIALDRANLGRLALVLPWSALLVALGSGVARAASRATVPGSNAVSVVVFTEPDCPYCEELRSRVMPEIEKEFGPRIQVRYRPAADLPAVRRTPTLILTPGRPEVQGRVIEGLPTLERLRGAIRDLETGS
jgi:hypothetical protein